MLVGLGLLGLVTRRTLRKELTMRKTFLISSLLSMIAGAPAAEASIIPYDVAVTFYEPDTQPNNTIFMGSFTYDDAAHAVSNLHGVLTESMTGTSTLALDYQLSSVYDASLGGLLVTTFLKNSTNTLSTLDDGNGWAPGSGYGLYYGFSGSNPGNAYAMIFVNTTNPLAPLTQAQIDRLAYADCAPGGMMGATCMTGTTESAYGTVGTMSGYPVSQTITATAPEPASCSMVLAGLGLWGLIARRRLA